MKIEIIRTPKIVIPPPPDAPKPIFRRLKKWSELDPKNNDGFSSARGQAPGETAGQQALYAPYLLRNGVWAGTWSVNQNSPEISNADWLRIASMQPTDEFTPADKMKHLTNGGDGGWGQALQAKYDPSSDWMKATAIKINQCPYAGNMVQVLEYKIMTIDTYGTVSMAHIKTGWDCINVYTAVTKDNVHYEKVKGTILLPLLAKVGWEWWILERWLHPPL